MNHKHLFTGANAVDLARPKHVGSLIELCGGIEHDRIMPDNRIPEQQSRRTFSRRRPLAADRRPRPCYSSAMKCFAWTAIGVFLLATVSLDAAVKVERVSTAVPFPRGMVIVDGQMYVLSRGRVRGAGGVSAAVNDRAGTIWTIDKDVAEDALIVEPSQRVRENAIVFAEPTAPPFRLWDRTSQPPQADRNTDRPYCVLRYDPISKNFFLCAFSGVDLKREPGKPSFSKNYTDAVLRFDVASRTWHEVERHNDAAGGEFPHHDPAKNPAPHGWLKGPNNCLVVGRSLYAVGKENHRLVRYDLSTLDQPAPASERVLDSRITLDTGESIDLLGHSALAHRDNWLYLATRTSGHVVRIATDDAGVVRVPNVIQLVARFDAWDRDKGTSADITDIGFDRAGRLYVNCAEPLSVHRFTPDPANVYDARDGRAQPWADVAAMLNKPTLKGENLLVDDAGRVYLSTGDGYGYQAGAEGTIYRLRDE
jgi:hypothetical protein